MKPLSGGLLLAALLLSGCTNLSGLQGSSRYACQAPEGVACDSMSGVYANAMQQRLPSQRAGAGTASPAPAPHASARKASDTPPAPVPAVLPLRAGTRVLRLWIKPWEDRDGDLHDQSFVYVRIDDGRWLLDHLQRQVREPYAPLRPPLAAPTADEPDAVQRPVRPAPPSFDALLEPLPSETEPSP